MRDTSVFVYIANRLGIAAAAPLPPSPPTERWESDSFYGKMIGTAVLLMTRFFTKPLSLTKSRETKC